MAQASVMGYITTTENTNTTTISNSNYTNGQYEGVEYPRRDTITIQTEGPVSIDQIFTYFDNLSLLDQVRYRLKHLQYHNKPDISMEG